MTRNEWLASLKLGDVVSLRRGGDEISAEVIANLGNRGFVLHESGHGQSVLSLAEISTEETTAAGYAIFPGQEPSTVDVREGTNEPLQDALQCDPLPRYSKEDSAPQIAEFLARDGMAGGWEAA